MAIGNTTFLSETILFIRDRLRARITDPIATARVAAGEKFVMTSYPRELVQYPLITVKGDNATVNPLGQNSETSIIQLTIEVRIWGRNEKEKNTLADAVITYLQHNQIPSSTANTSQNVELYDFKILSATEVDDPGEEGIKSRILTIEYKFIAT